MNQFLLEAITVTFLGGLIGIIGGSFLSYLIAVVARYLGYDWAFIISLGSVLLSIGVSASVGLIFGLYPANKASKLQPVEALRYE
jgi:putative ABC transport system permease protein